MHIIINAQLVNPPSSVSCFRTLTMVAHVFCHHSVLIETDFEKDPYYKFLKKFGAMDFVDDILNFDTTVDSENYWILEINLPSSASFS